MDKLPVRRRFIFLLFIVAQLTCCTTWALAQFDPRYTTGEIDLVEKQYVGPYERVGGQANFLHGIEVLQKLLPGQTLSGDGVIVAVWDEGLIQSNHQDLTPRVKIKDSQQANLFLSNHATHVGGAIAGTGSGRLTAKGVASGAVLWSYDFQNDLAEMNGLVQSGAKVHVSNHSYGFATGWSGVCVNAIPADGKTRLVWVWSGFENDMEDRRFGQYGTSASGFDALAQQQPDWTMVVAAGNSRAPLMDPHNAAKTVDFAAELTSIAGKYDFSFSGESLLRDCAGKKSQSVHPSNRHKGNGFDSIPFGPAAGKNVITVGAMQGPPLDEIFDAATGQFRQLERKHVVPTEFSSWGPVDDGRVKPDIVASGHAEMSTAIPPNCEKKPCKPADATGAGENANYVQMSGTSMAAPVVSGAVALLNELSNKQRSRNLRSDEARAILIQTALSPAGVEGPTYKVGWGAMQAELAGRLLTGNEKGDSIAMVDIHAERTTKVILKREGLRPPRVTLVWLDKEGISQNDLNNRTSQLVYNIDMTLTTPSGQLIHPWILDPTDPSAPAKRDNNIRDNVERIDVPAEMTKEDGKWVLEIAGKSWQGATEVRAALAVWGFSRVANDE